MQKPVKVFGSHELKSNPELNKQDTRNLERVDTDGTTVKVLAGLTLTQNYNSVRVDVGIDVPTTFAEKEKAVERAWDFVDKELDARLSDVRELLIKL